ncbi:MAG: helix-turn-helix domain-containing protein [Pseudomonas sp.]|nr:helix-turn-helix domain-containing protein [Pseudomonas sp.]
MFPIEMSQEEFSQMGIGKRIRMAIDALGLTIRQASELTGISYSSLQNWIGEHREPRPDALITIGSRLGISIDWLLTGEGPMRREEATPAVAAEEPAAPGISPREAAMLELFRSLDEDGQREIQGAAAEKKRLSDLEQRIKELEAVVSDIKRLA